MYRKALSRTFTQ